MVSGVYETCRDASWPFAVALGACLAPELMHRHSYDSTPEAEYAVYRGLTSAALSIQHSDDQYSRIVVILTLALRLQDSIKSF
jgi:hypothetical protein